MIENRPWLTIFSHTMLILGIAVILFPLYVAFVAATLDKQAVYAAPMTLIPGTYLLENIHNIWVNGVGTNSAPFWRMLLNSFVMASWWTGQSLQSDVQSPAPHSHTPSRWR